MSPDISFVWVVALGSAQWVTQQTSILEILVWQFKCPLHTQFTRWNLIQNMMVLSSKVWGKWLSHEGSVTNQGLEGPFVPWLRKYGAVKTILAQWDSSVDKDACCQVWSREFNLWNHHGGGSEPVTHSQTPNKYNQRNNIIQEAESFPRHQTCWSFNLGLPSLSKCK